MVAARTLVFDLDGTLADTVPDLAASLNRVLGRRGLAPFTRAEVAGMVGDGAAALVARAFTARAQQQDVQALPDFLVDYGAHYACDTRAYPGVDAALGRLAAAGWRLAVCTNKPHAPAHDLLAALGIGHYFAAIGGGDSFPTRKPDPAHLVATIAAAGGIPARALMAGDHRNDVSAAAGAGIPGIFVAWGYGTAPMGIGAAAVAAAVAELPELAERLLPA